MTGSSIEIRAMELFELACEQPPDVRFAWINEASNGNIDLRDRVLALIKNDQSKDSIVATGQAIRAAYKNTETNIPVKIGSYTIMRLIGQGGMGSVYEGVRNNDDFDHKVAIKVIKPGLLSKSLTERFIRERQVLANLNHPGIARLFDGGQLEDGSPYFVMEYVDGEPIGKFATDSDLNLLQRLNLFIQVCEATKYAHTNLIVHRDITTSNVLVSKTGMAKLIDFGISKPETHFDCEKNSEHSSLGGLSFTPGFSAPERLSGAAVTVLSDIFSLGCLLAAIVPSELRNEDIGAIIEKASAHETKDRYASVDGLQNDVKNYRDNFPVEARNGGANYKLKKFAIRNKVFVGSIGLAVTAILGGLFSATVSYHQAEAARVEATQRFAQTREMANFLVSDVSEKIISIPGTLEVRQAINAKSETYLKLLKETSSGDPIIALEYAILLSRNAEYASMAGGDANYDVLKSNAFFKEALEVYSVIETQKDRLTESGLKETADVKFAETYLKYGTVKLVQQGEIEEGLEILNTAVYRLDTLIQDYPDRADIFFWRADGRQRIASALTAKGDIVGARVALNNMLRNIEVGIKKFPNYERGTAHLALMSMNTADTDRLRWTNITTGPVPLEDKAAYSQARVNIQRSIDLRAPGATQKLPDSEDLTWYLYSNIIMVDILAAELSWPRAPEDKNISSLILSYLDTADSALNTLKGVGPRTSTLAKFEAELCLAKANFHQIITKDPQRALQEVTQLISIIDRDWDAYYKDGASAEHAIAHTLIAELKFNQDQIVNPSVCRSIDTAKQIWKRASELYGDEALAWYSGQISRTNRIASQIQCK